MVYKGCFGLLGRVKDGKIDKHIIYNKLVYGKKAEESISQTI